MRAVALSPVAPHPTAKGAIFAEARLIWESATWIKWPLAVAALLAGLLPGNFAQGLFLVLLVPVISEVAAREKLAGTRALVYSQPGVPSSPALWKAAAVSIVVLMLGAPLAMKCFLVSPIRGLACLAGLVAVAGISVGLGSLSSGGKLFSGLYLAVWYMGLSNLPAADFTSALSTSPVPVWSFLYMGLGAALVGGGGGAGAGSATGLTAPRLDPGRLVPRSGARRGNIYDRDAAARRRPFPRREKRQG